MSADPQSGSTAAHLRLRGGDCYVLFDPEKQRTSTDLELETELRHAFEQERFRVQYRPVVSLKSGDAVELEAVLRWQHPERGLLMPGDFVPLAEESGIVYRLGAWLLREVCRQLAAWQEQFGARGAPAVSVQLSEKQFAHADTPDQIRRALEQNGAQPDRLVVEVPCVAVLADADAAAETLRRLKETGVRTCLVHTAEAESASLSELTPFALDRLKIRGALVKKLETDAAVAGIVAAVVQLVRQQGLEVVVEGVETAGQRERFAALECAYAQGDFFGEPLGAAAAVERLGLTAG